MFDLITQQQAEEHLEALKHSPLAWGTGEDAMQTIIHLWKALEGQQQLNRRIAETLDVIPGIDNKWGDLQKIFNRSAPALLKHIAENNLHMAKKEINYVRETMADEIERQKLARPDLHHEIIRSLRG